MPRRSHLLAGLATGALAVALGGSGAIAEDCSTSACRADVDISGHAEPQPIYTGQMSEFKFTAKDDGPASAAGIELQAVIPAGLQIKYVNTYGAPGCTPKGNFVDCFLGDFVREQEAVVRIGIYAPTAGTYVSKAKVYSMANDPNGGNGQVGATLGVKKRPPGSTTLPGDPPAGSGGSDGSGSGSGSGSSGSGGSGSGSGSSGSGGGSAGSMNVPDPQRPLKTGGVKLTVHAAKSGTLRVRGTVKTSGGSIKLTSVTLGGVKAGSTRKVFLGTTPKALSRIRAALRGGAKLDTVVTANLDGAGLKTQTHLRR